MSGTSGLPPIDQSQLPADIRNGSTDRKKAYEAALGFEQVLVQQLTKTLANTAQPVDGTSDTGSDDGTGTGGGTDVATQTYQSMLPDTLAGSIMSAGGLGLARQMVPVQTADTGQGS